MTATAIAWLSLLLLACPPRDIATEVSLDAARRIMLACNPNEGSSCGDPIDPSAPFGLSTHLIDKNGGVAQRGGCATVSVSDCFALEPDAEAVCIQNAFAVAVDASIPEGITYDGLEDSTDATLVASIHQPADGCSLDAISGCLVFELPIDSDVYDVGCVSCSGGPAGGVGCETSGGCPFGECVMPGDCAIDICRRVLAP